MTDTTYPTLIEICRRFPKFDDYFYVTATTQGEHAAHSYHYLGEAIDIGSGNRPASIAALTRDKTDRWSQMDALASWLAGYHDHITELLHTRQGGATFPGGSYVHNGGIVSNDYYGAADVSAHQNHVHFAISTLSQAQAMLSQIRGDQVSWLKGCDFSYDKPDLVKLWAAGYRVILVYLSDSGKGFTQAYIQQALDLGFKILPLYETTAGAALGGYDVGRAHATFAIAKAKAQGVPVNVPIIYALDQNFTDAQLAGPVSDYVRGLSDVAGADELYGGFHQLDYLIRHGFPGRQNFQTYAWSSGQWLPAEQAPIEQFHNGVSVAGGIVDDCRVDSSIIFWESDMALTSADAKLVADAVWASDSIPVTPVDLANPNWVASNSVGYLVSRERTSVAAPTAAEIAAAVVAAMTPVTVPSAADVAAAVVAALPPASTGGLTASDVETAVHAGLAKLSLSLAE